jgi:hypothetical protein
MNLQDVRAIGQVLDTTFGRESSPDGTFSIKYTMEGDSLILKYTTIVYFASESALKPQIDMAHNQAIQLINAKLSEAKSAVKDATGSTLKTVDIGGSDNIELIQPHGPRKIAYYRYNHTFQIQD